VATGGPGGASHARTAGGTGRGGSAGAACTSSGGRFSGALAGPPPGAGAGSVAAPDAGDVATSAPAPASATTPAGRGGFRHSRPLGSYGSRMPGGTGGRTGTAGPRPVGPDVAGAAGAVPAPGAVAAVDGSPAGAGDGAPMGPAGGVAGDGSISAEGDLVLRGPPMCRGPPWERRRRRRRGTQRGGCDASCGTATRGQERRGRPHCPTQDAGGAYPTRRRAPCGPHGGLGWRAREGAAGDV